MKRRLLILLVFISCVIPYFASAKTLTMYDQPVANAKIAGTIDPASGVIPIFTPKEGGWVKVADPKNGNVGWIKSDELNNAGNAQFIFSYTQGGGNNTSNGYRVIQLGQPNNLSPEQTQAINKQLQMERENMHRSMMNMMRDMDRLYQDSGFMQGGFPFLMPVVVVPVEKSNGNQVVQTNNLPASNKSSQTTTPAATPAKTTPVAATTTPSTNNPSH